MESDTHIKTEPVWLQKDQEMFLDMKEELNPGMHSLGEEDNSKHPGTSNSDLLEDEFMKNIELKNEITIENHDIGFEDKEESSPDTTSNAACEESGEVFSNSEELSKNNIPSKKHLYKCAICSKAFPCKSHLSSHMRSHNNKKSHQCEQCGKVLQTKSSLVVHRITHIAEQPFKCEVCGRMFQSRSAHRVHIKKHLEPDKLYSCDICCLDFKTNRILLNHLRTHDGQLLYKCTICDKAYVRECQLEKHSARMHSWKCNFCGKEFSGSSAITHHIRTHTGDWPFKCNFCDKTFTQQSHLTRHLKIHTSVPEQLIKTKRDIQVYDCNFCEKKFLQCSALVKHTIVTGHSTALSME